MGKKKKKNKYSLPSRSYNDSPSISEIINEAREEEKRKAAEKARRNSTIFSWEQICRFASGVTFKKNKENLTPSPSSIGSNSPNFSTNMTNKVPSYYERWFALVNEK